MSFIDDIFGWFKGAGELLKGKDLALQAVQIASSLPFPLLLCDKKFSILLVNPAFTRIFAIDADRLKGKTLFQILGADVRIQGENGRERQISSLPQVIGKRNPKVLKGVFPKLGPRVFHLYSRVIRPNLLLVFHDVTEESDFKGKIEKSRSELLSVFDGIDDPMVMIDRNLSIRRINEAMLKALGATSYQGFIGKACYFKIHGRRERCLECTADKTFRSGGKTSRFGLIEGRPRADESSYQITYYPLKDSAGSVTEIAEFYRDVTEVQRTEEELYESERSRVMEPLAAGIAHEVRNPLAIIQSTAQYCLGELDPNHKDLQESLQAIIRNTEQANRVIGNLLDFARPSPAAFKRQPLGPLLQKALGLIKARARAQRVRLVRRISGGLPSLLLDGNRFIQAMINFLVNSLDAMPHGGHLEIEARRRNANRSVTVVVRDSGKGIPEEMLSKILQPFYSTKTDGVGLGLPLAEGIIRSHGGRVHFKSCVGKGTEARIELPLNTKGRREAV